MNKTLHAASPLARTNQIVARGFSLIELLIAVGVIAILATLAVVGYDMYKAKARAADIVESVDAVRKDAAVAAPDGETSSCADVIQRFERKNLSQNYARMDYGLEAVSGGYRPVLTVCTTAGKHGPGGVQAARTAYELLSRTGAMEQKAVLSDTLVSFAVGLTPADRSVCRVPFGSKLTPCGDPVAVPTMPVVQTPTPAALAAVPAPTPMELKVPKIQAYVMQFAGTDTYVRPGGRNLNTNGDLQAFTLDMSFIGDGNIPAASGGQGPVMFNYGDSTNSHNAISLWNPRSLTIALNNVNYNTGVNLVDGQTHRVTVSWDSRTGALAVYDNGRLVKTFADVSKGQAIHGGGAMVVAHKDNGGTYSPGEAFAGQVFHTSIANVAVSAEQAAKPLNQVLDVAGGLLADFRAEGGTIRDTTGRHTVETGGVTAVMTGVDTNLVSAGKYSPGLSAR